MPTDVNDFSGVIGLITDPFFNDDKVFDQDRWERALQRIFRMNAESDERPMSDEASLLLLSAGTEEEKRTSARGILFHQPRIDRV